MSRIYIGNKPVKAVMIGEKRYTPFDRSMVQRQLNNREVNENMHVIAGITGAVYMNEYLSFFNPSQRYYAVGFSEKVKAIETECADTTAMSLPGWLITYNGVDYECVGLWRNGERFHAPTNLSIAQNLDYNFGQGISPKIVSANIKDGVANFYFDSTLVYSCPGISLGRMVLTPFAGTNLRCYSWADAVPKGEVS